VIGLTGNIATGKSVVRRMLEHLGAYTIDADALSHRAIAKGAPGYGPVLETFGKWLLEEDGEVDRAKLGELAFRDPAAMAQLEKIIHPLVRQAIDVLIKRASQKVIVIEAIKLLEGPLKEYCDSIWVTYAPPVVQVDRLTRKRHLTREEAQRRIGFQEPQEAKVAAAGLVIRNIGSYDDLWNQVSAAWKELPLAEQAGPATMVKPAAAGEFAVSRGKPRDSKAIADLITHLSRGRQKLSAGDIMESFGDKAYMLLQLERKLVGLASWQVENLVVRVGDIYLDQGLDEEKALETLINEVERASADLQCEASLLFPPPELATREGLWTRLGYARRTPGALGVQAWEDAASESNSKNGALFFKQLRQDRVLRPI
jgi:dephospho-CoA kinase